MDDEARIQKILGSLSGVGDELVDNFEKFIKQYKTFHDFEHFDLQKSEQTIIKTLQDRKKDIDAYWVRNARQDVPKSEVKRFLSAMNFAWDEPTVLFYFLNVTPIYYTLLALREGRREARSDQGPVHPGPLPNPGAAVLLHPRPKPQQAAEQQRRRHL